MKISNIKQHHIHSFKGHSHEIKEYTGGDKRDYLEEIGLYPPYSTLFANFRTKRFKRAIDLVKSGVEPNIIPKVSKLRLKQYKKAIQLANDGLFDNFLYSIATMKEPFFTKAINYRKNGLSNDCLELFAKLSFAELEIAKKLMSEEGFPPIVAGNLAKLSEEKRKIAIEFIEDADVETACKIAQLDKEQREKCKKYLSQGINANYIIELSQLSKKQEKRLPEIFELKVGDINITDFAKMTEFEFKRAKELISLGVNPNAIFDIILIEEGKGKNKDYSTYRNRGYSYSSSAALSALNDIQIEALEKLIEIHPELRNLFKEEYNISVIQLQNDDQQEAILTRNIRTQDGTNITLVQTFDTYGDKTQSRLETYPDNSTSSVMKNRTGVFKAKYDKYGQIKELTELLQDIDTREVTGVIHTKASSILTGALESTYYDIQDIKEGGNTTPDIDFENCILPEANGIEISSVKQNEDGSITYIEDFQLNDYIVARHYTEKREENGEITYSNYSYKINTLDDYDNERTIMNISREFIKNKDGSTTNKINGIEYTITYDDSSKSISITDGKKHRKIDFSKILPIFSEDIIWNNLKQIQVDSLLTIGENVEKWGYGKEDFSLTDEYNKTLITGKNTGIITHEVGHIKTKEDISILKDDELIQTYGEEMDTFKVNMPFNEQEFIQYFSQRAELTDSDGLEEFIAETNVLLTTYGMNYKDLNTRTQFLAKYFPRTISRIAELLGKTSTKSLLE